jgi:hypothetical protein
MSSELSVEDRDFLVDVLGLPNRGPIIAHVRLADAAVAAELLAISSRLGNPAQRALALRVASIPIIAGESFVAVKVAHDLIIQEINMLTNGGKPPVRRPPKPEQGMLRMGPGPGRDG